MASPSSILTRGLGTWGEKLLVTLGFGSGVLAPPTNVTLPVISGSAVQGNVLSGSNGTWLNAPTSFTYQWYRDGVLIAGATTANYTATADDLGHALTIAVTASNSAGSSTATSLPTALVQSGSRQEGGAGPRRRRLPDRRQEVVRQNEEALALILIMELE